MIKKKRRKFFIIITAVLVLLYAVASFTMFLIIKQDFYKKEVKTLNLLLEISEKEPQSIQDELKTVDGIILQITGFGDTIYHSDKFTKEEVEELFEKVKVSKNGYVRIDNYSLLIKDNVAVAIDATEHIITQKATIFRVMEGLGILFVLLVVFTFFLVGKTVQPLAESLTKQKAFISDASHELNTPKL